MMLPKDEITFFVIKKSVRGYRLVVREGKMIEYGTKLSTVSLKNGHKILVPTDCIRKAGEKNALTEMVLEAFDAN